MRRTAAHVDANQPEIVEALLRHAPGEVSVQSLAAIGVGCPDLLVGYKGVNLLMEVKNPDGLNGNVRRGDVLTDDQKKFHKAWRGQIHIVQTAEDAVELLLEIT